MKNRTILATGIGLALLGLGTMGSAHAGKYVVMTQGQGLNATQIERIQAAGGTITAQLPQIGVAIVQAGDAFAADAGAIPGLQSVTRDVELQWDVPESEGAPISADAFANPPGSGDDDRFFDLQWGHAALDAAGAWNAGYRGAGATVAVLDSGAYCAHLDIAPNLIGGASFVDGESYCNTSGSSHGTHVAGTILAADNAIGTIGVAPEAKLLAVKVLSSATGSGDFAGIIQGIVWAVDNGANVINMSLGVRGGLPRSGQGANELSELINATKRAMQYAGKNEVLVVASAGNDGRDLDHDNSTMSFPGQLPGVLTVSALAPEGWAIDAGVDLDVLASYSNYGQSTIHFGAPGGDTRYPGNELCTVGPVTQVCWIFDAVFSTTSVSGGSHFYGWNAGTSMAAPHVSGVAALVYGKHPGIKASHVATILKQSADDVGKPGKDDSAGFGRVNAAQAVTY
ncbi:S8 family peptidase [Marilutibacter maris]|uniref:S8 family serine peptidase n=2 Tax=Marilutibacter maris TaxID=1605891 RepID=A0A508B7A3_9GAMM|nr:S8 family serine peptidase [Lysobacter maris]KAB8198280.1 S8 family serine peptidase [Lysobacter maris]